MEHKIRTDLAVEIEQLRRGEGAALPGVRSRTARRGGFELTTTEVLDDTGAAALGKPVGRYVTLELGALLRREENAFADAAALLAEQLRALAPLPHGAPVLVVGLGNRDITPDAVGPAAVDSVMVTRHLRELLPEHFGAFRPVTAVCAGVLGTTGIESGDLVSAVASVVEPAAVIAVDALASRSASHLGSTVQLADTGIVPGSGVGNARSALSRETLGVPVIAVGVPTVVDAGTLAADLGGADADLRGLVVTPRDIDRLVRDAAKLVGYGINLALHEGLTVADVDMLLS